MMYVTSESEAELWRQLGQIRRFKEITQTEVAFSMDTKKSTISRWECGGGKKCHSCTLRTVIRYLKSLGLVMDIKVVEESIAALKDGDPNPDCLAHDLGITEPPSKNYSMTVDSGST